jgi:nucleoid DNA-binding protein
MKKDDIARRLARRSHTSKAAAADQLDRIVHDILTELRKGKAFPLPGLGRFTPGARPGFEFETRTFAKGPQSGQKQR